jgi:hypothetical protein
VRRILFVFPNAWDRKQLSACRDAWAPRYEVAFAEPTDEDCPWDFDVLSFIDEMVREHAEDIAGVSSSSDYPGATVAAAIATRLGLAGSLPERVIGCSHKYYSRLTQRAAVPEATPRFWLIDPRDPQTWSPVEFPCYIKPVKGAFSIMSRPLDSREDLQRFLSRPSVHEFLENYVAIFNRLVRALTEFDVDGHYFLAEELFRGAQVTLEGFVYRGHTEVLGIVDSETHSGTGSFIRFDYPSRMPLPVQERMAQVASRAVEALGLENTLFNIEMIYDREADRIGIIEVNPRICGQFADLYQKVDGINGYEVALSLAAGGRPAVHRGEGSFKVAASFPLRIFEPSRVLRAPSETDLRSIESEFAGALIWSECEQDQELTNFERVEDGKSYRYAIVNIGGQDGQDLESTYCRVLRRLDFQFLRLRR